MLCQIFGGNNYFTYKYFSCVEKNKYLKKNIVLKYLRKNSLYKYYIILYMCLFYAKLQNLLIYDFSFFVKNL